MRFVFNITLALLYSLLIVLAAPKVAAQTATWKHSEVNLTKGADQNAPRLQKGKRASQLKTLKGFQLTAIAQGLGTISTITSDGQGRLYVADQESGRIWALTDRANDGRIDLKQALPHRFDSPTGLAIHKDDLYVADKNAVWRVKGPRPPEKLAGLLAINSTGQHHPISLLPNGETLRLAIHTQDNQIKVLDIRLSDGQANLVETVSSSQPVIAFAPIQGSSPWLLLSNALGPSLNQLTAYAPSQNFTGISLMSKALIVKSETSQSGEAIIDENSMMIARQSPDGFDIVSVRTRLGKPQNKAQIIISGFSPKNARSAWGSPGALLSDQHGLLIADRFNGDIYRLTAQPVPPSTKTVSSSEEISPKRAEDKKETPSTSPPSTLLSTMTGSQIDNASTLNSASGLDVGSTIIRDYKPLEVNKDKVKKDGGEEATGEEEATNKGRGKSQNRRASSAPD
jgi:hypothetical protein